MRDKYGYSNEFRMRQARWKLEASMRHAEIAEEEANAIRNAATRDEWLRIAREARSDVRYWREALVKAARAAQQ